MALRPLALVFFRVFRAGSDRIRESSMCNKESETSNIRIWTSLSSPSIQSSETNWRHGLLPKIDVERKLRRSLVLGFTGALGGEARRSERRRAVEPQASKLQL
jgi:hypothetical protein